MFLWCIVTDLSLVSGSPYGDDLSLCVILGALSWVQFILRFHDLCGVMALMPLGALFLWWGWGVPARYWHRGRNISCAGLTGLLLLLQCFLSELRFTWWYYIRSHEAVRMPKNVHRKVMHLHYHKCLVRSDFTLYDKKKMKSLWVLTK